MLKIILIVAGIILIVGICNSDTNVTISRQYIIESTAPTFSQLKVSKFPDLFLLAIMISIAVVSLVYRIMRTKVVKKFAKKLFPEHILFSEHM